MKAVNLTYWISTALLSGWMIFSAWAYLSDQPMIADAFASLGYPGYFAALLGVAKLMGAFVLLVPRIPLFKEWAYAGFTFTFVGALWSHLASGQPGAIVLPVFAMIILAVSYVTRPLHRCLLTFEALPGLATLRRPFRRAAVSSPG